jgi:hypothetical protein
MSQAVYKFLAIALVVGVIGPLFWLGVNMVETAIKRTRWGRHLIAIDAWLADLPGSLLGRRKSTQDAQRLSGPAGRGRQ